MTQTEEKMAQKIFPMVLISGFSFGFYCSSYIIQIAGLARKIHDSSTLNEKFQAEVSHNPDLQTSAKHALDRRVPTRWNADFLCLSAHLHFKSVIQSMTGVSENKLKPYRLSDEQWELSDDLGDVLKVFIVFYYCAFMLIFKQLFDTITNLFSQSSVPLVTEVLPALFDLRDSLAAVADDMVPDSSISVEEELRPTPSVIRIAAYASVLMVDKYLDLIWDCDIYVIAIGMIDMNLLLLF